MPWNWHHQSFIGNPGSGLWAPNHAAYSPASFGAFTSFNHPASASPNHAAYNHAAYGAPNHAAYGAPNHAAYAAPNHAAYASPNHAAHVAAMAGGAGPAPVVAVANGTGAGGASGTGFLGGYGPIARFEYATPAGLGPIPWALDFASGDGWPSFPLDQMIDPAPGGTPLQWHHGDWDPALRFWTLPFDPQLTEWLQDLNLGAPAIVAAREFAAYPERWVAPGPGAGHPASALFTRFEDGLPADVFGWRAADPRVAIQVELQELIDLMRDDRMRYLDELALQSSHTVPYFVHLMGFDPSRKPWTMELMNCATAIGNLVKMQYKAHYRRVRPSTLLPALVPPWGPPRHPAFPSGHSTVAHLTALFLLSVPGIAQRFGVFAKAADPDGELAIGIGGEPSIGQFVGPDAKPYGSDERSPLLWLAWRIARGRERLGLHYCSDSAAGRRLAALVWDDCVQSGRIPMPALHEVRLKAVQEWEPLVTDSRPPSAAAPGPGGPKRRRAR